MSIFGTSGGLGDIERALRDLERNYLTAGASAVRGIETRLQQFSKTHPNLSVRGVAGQFESGRCAIAINDALEASNQRVNAMLAATVKDLSFDQVSGILKEITKDIVMYIGGGAAVGGAVGGAVGFFAFGVGAVPGAAVGAEVGIQIGTAIMTVIGLAELAEAMVKVVPALCVHVYEGFAKAIRAGMVQNSDHKQYRELMTDATESFAQAKFILVIALMTAIVALIAHKGMTAAMEKIGGSKLGKGFAEWMQKNHEIAARNPAFRPVTRGSAQAPGKAASAEKPPAAEAETPKTKKNADKAEGEGKIGCPKCVLVAAPINPLTGSKILADTIDLDFALPAPLPLVWQRSYSSAQRQAGWLGSGWTVPLSRALQVNVDSVVILDAFAREITFSLPAIGESRYSPSEKITLVRTQDRSFELIDDKGERDLFALPETSNTIARLVGQIDANGNRITITYNGRQLPERVEDSAGRSYLLSFEDHRGHPRLRNIAVQLAAPATGTELLVAYEYDAAGNLAKVSNGQGVATRQFAYRNHVMVEHSQPGGLVSRYEYDEYAASGKVTRNWTNNGRSWDLRYLAQETIVTDNLGRVERYRFDAKKRLIGKVDAAGGVTTHRLDSNGNILAITDPGGRSVNYRYDQRGRVIRIESGGSGTGIVYDNRFDKPALITDALGATTALRYDEFGNLASMTDALGHRTAYQYDEHGLPVRVTDAAGGVKRLAYNRAGQLISYTDCSNNTTHFSYDDKGRMIRTLDAIGNDTTYSYESDGRLSTTVRPDGSLERYEYDAFGRLTARIDPAGHRTQYVLDSTGKLVKRIDARGGELAYRYDEAERISELINENGDTHRFVYDALDRLVEETGFDSTMTRYRYDDSGLAIAREEYGSDQRTPYTRIDTHYSRDITGQLLEKIVSRATSADSAEQIRLRYAYDPVGRLTQAINAAAEVTLEYDALGQLVGERTKTRESTTALRHAYDELGNRVETTLPDGRVLNHLFYGSGHLHQINIDGEVITDIERDQLHRAVSRTQGALTSQFQYDPMGRMLAQMAGRMESTPGSDPTIARRYEYDVTGNLLSINDNRKGRKTYRYDAIGRIIHAVQPDLVERFAFDPAHNLLDTTVSGAGRVEGNRLKVFEDKRYDYDAHGNLTEKLSGKHTRIQLEWNAAHQLVESTTTRHADEETSTVQTVQYAYDPFGRRISKRDAFGTTRFIWDGNRLLCESRGQWARTYAYEPLSFVPLAQVDTVTEQGAPGAARSSVHYLHTDHLGTPNEMTDQDGTLTWAAAYQTWGNVVLLVNPETGPLDCASAASTQQALATAQPIRFQGQYYDAETGLHYNRFRYYDADCGRFVSLDPIGLAGGNNMYQYAANPVAWIDPLGLAGYKVGAQTAGGDMLSRGVHVNVHGPGLPPKGGHIGFLPDGNGGVKLVPVDKATRDLNPRQWAQASASVGEYMNNPKNVDRMAKAAQAGVDAYPNSGRAAEMKDVRDILEAHKVKGTCPC